VVVIVGPCWQELTCVLFEALERSDPARFKAINGLWQGTSVAYTQPVALTDPSQRHERREDFMDIQVRSVTVLGWLLCRTFSGPRIMGFSWVCIGARGGHGDP